MYYISQITDTLRVPPHRFDENLQDILLELARESMEEQEYVLPDLGIIVAVLEAIKIGNGRLIPQDGGAFYPCQFKVLSYKPERGEVIEGRVMDIAEFGAFIQVSSTEALCHTSQIADDQFRFLSSDRALIGKDQKLRLDIGDMIRGRIIVVGMQKKAIRIGITMRQAGLGHFTWINNWKTQMASLKKS